MQICNWNSQIDNQVIWCKFGILISTISRFRFRCIDSFLIAALSSWALPRLASDYLMLDSVYRGCSNIWTDGASDEHSIDCPAKTYESGRFASIQSGTTSRYGSALDSWGDRSAHAERGQSDTHRRPPETLCLKHHVSLWGDAKTPPRDLMIKETSESRGTSRTSLLQS